MKRFFAILLLGFMAVSFLAPFFAVKNETTEEVLCTYARTSNVIAVEVVQEDPIELAIAEMRQKLDSLDGIDSKLEWYVAYKEIVAEYSDVLDPPESVYDYYTADEIYLMQRMVETECYDCDFESKVNVASVLFNRLEHGGEFGDTVEEVITSPNQFAYCRKEITEETILAVEYAFEIEDTTNGCIAFRSGERPAVWYDGWEYSFSDNAIHHFYKEVEEDGQD